MDPKLDSGYVGPGESIDDEYDVMRPLSPEQTIGVMDQLLCQEVSGGDGRDQDDGVDGTRRWHGIWEVRYRKRCSRPYTWIGYWAYLPSHWLRSSLMDPTDQPHRCLHCLAYCERTASHWSSVVASCTA